MQQAQLTIRIDQKLKKQAQDTAENFGLPLSSLIKAFLTNVVKTKKFALNKCSDEYFDSIIMESCHDKKITSKLEKLADAVIKKFPNSL
ncbi:MAG: type II toxin-antitoxin system RelB/DinJ family antitoxin [Patescibacteria group bacterium]|nr:type II toxin-antitoxin system RelB/DinJ family antitoxin [Patescibacteria group bacterium]